jgi:hypothetical protein
MSCADTGSRWWTESHEAEQAQEIARLRHLITEAVAALQAHIDAINGPARARLSAVADKLMEGISKDPHGE